MEVRPVAPLTEVRPVAPWPPRRTWVERQVEYIHRPQRGDLSILAGSRANWLRTRRSAIESLRGGSSCCSTHEGVMLRGLPLRELSGGFILNTRVPLRAMKVLFLLAYPYEQLAVFFNYSRTPTSIWRSCFAYSRISTSNLFRQGV